MRKSLMVRCGIGAIVGLSAWAGTLAQMPNPYGMPINLATAGNLVYYERMDNTQVGSATVAIDKARTAVLFKRPSKALQDTLAAGGEGLRVLGLRDATPVEGGLTLVVDGKIVGAIGVSGATSAQDGQCAKAGADSLK